MFVFPSAPGAEVLILGAGFSKALSPAMPETDALGNEVLDQVRARSRDLSEEVVGFIRARSPVDADTRFKNGEFEAWLSRIAEDQPDLKTAENLANRTLFELCSEALAKVLEERVRQAEVEALSRSWLPRLLGTMHLRQATVVTFNQDALLELATDDIANLHSWDQRRWSDKFAQPPITSRDILDDQPRLPPSWWYEGAPQATFRLLKLHGSTNWYWRPGDLSGATTARWFLPGRVPVEEAMPDEAAALQRNLPGRVPLIVPPAAAKSSYYQIPLLTQLWQDARAALSRDKVRVSVIGYSIPPTDLVTSGMLRETLIDRLDGWAVPIDVVNPCPGPASAHLASLGVAPAQVMPFGSVEDFATEYERKGAEELVAAFRAWEASDTDCLLLVGSSFTKSSKVVEVRDGDDEIELILEENIEPYTGINVHPGASLAGLPNLLEHLSNPALKRLVAVPPSGPRRLVVGASQHGSNVGAGNGRWQVLMTAESVR